MYDYEKVKLEMKEIIDTIRGDKIGLVMSLEKTTEILRVTQQAKLAMEQTFKERIDSIEIRADSLREENSSLSKKLTDLNIQNQTLGRQILTLERQVAAS